MNQFFETYKRLDLLIKDSLNCENGVSGITAYIDAMKAANPTWSRRIPEWEYVLLRLKKYRHIRNQMAHESSHDPFTQQDIMWLNSFYQRTLRRDDPLAKYDRLQRQSRQNSMQKTKPCPIQPVPKLHYNNQEIKRDSVRPYTSPAKSHYKQKKTLPVWGIFLILFVAWVLVFGLLFWIIQSI